MNLQQRSQVNSKWIYNRDYKQILNKPKTEKAKRHSQNTTIKKVAYGFEKKIIVIGSLKKTKKDNQRIKLTK